MTAEKHPLETVREALEKGIELLEPFEESGLLGNQALNKHRSAITTLNHYLCQTQSCAECERLGRENARLREAVRDLGTSLKALLAVETQSAGLNENTISNKQLFEQFMLDCESAVRGAVNLSRKNLEKHAATIAAAGGE